MSKTKVIAEELVFRPGAGNPLPKTVKMLQNLLSRKKIDKRWYDKLKPEKRLPLANLMQVGLNVLGGHSRDKLISITENVIGEGNKKAIKDFEYANILVSLTSLTKEQNRPPTRNELATRAGFSLASIERFYADYSGSILKGERQEDLEILRERMLASIFNFGIAGNIKAARLFMEITGPRRDLKHVKIENQQNNLIQLNGRTITQEELKRLPEELYNKFFEVVEVINSTATLPDCSERDK